MTVLRKEAARTGSAAIDRRRIIERFFDALVSGDLAVLQELLAADAVTRWPQSGERMTGAGACVRVYAAYPGGPPSYRLLGLIGDGTVWVAQLVADYGSERWHVVSVIEFEGDTIARVTDYFGPTLPVPQWRLDLVELEPGPVPA